MSIIQFFYTFFKFAFYNNCVFFYCYYAAISSAFFALFILFITFLVTYFLYINQQNRELIKYITPIVLAGLLLIETIFYSIIHKGSIKEYFLFNFDGVFATSKFAIILTAFFGTLTIIIVDYLCFVDLMVYTILIIFNVAIYLCSIYLFSFKRGKEVFYYLSNYHEFRMRRNVIRGGS